MWRFRLIPSKTHFDFVRRRYFTYGASFVLVLASVIGFFVFGLNFGIDFRGGTLIEISRDVPVNIIELRTQLASLDLGEVQIQQFGTPNDVLIRVSEARGATDTSLGLGAIERIRAALEGAYEFRRVEVVGPQVSAELVRAGVLAVLTAIAAMLAYIWFRFEWQFSLGAVLALVHDVVLTIGLFSFFQLDFNLSILAAILTIVGYSMNDTVVVYDRVRETLRKHKKMPLDALINLAINETLARTTMTSVTTLLALGALYVLGGEVIRGFSLAMIWGVLVGTYSSIFIAAPFLLVSGVKRDWSGTQKISD